MTTPNAIAPKPIYAPKGCNCPIMAHVTEDEREELKRIAGVGPKKQQAMVAAFREPIPI